jgi:polysaccharide biosynthesis/export protein
MLRGPFFLLFAAIFLTSGCFLPHPDEPAAPASAETSSARQASVEVSSIPATAVAAAKEAAAIAAAMQQVARSKTDYRLSAADLISVTVYQDKELDRKVRINTDGTVSLPLIGAIAIGGKSLAEAQSTIESKLAQYLVSPQVSLFIEDYGNKTVFVMGEVAKPGSYPIPTESRMTLLEAISTAGGFTPIAAQDRARVLRYVNGASVTYNINTKEITQQGQKDKDMVLEPNDIVYIPQSFF